MIGARLEVSVPNVPTDFRLGEARPNPFNPRTMISFDLPEAAEVRLAIYDISGRLVRTLVRGTYPAGHHGVEWDGTAQSGSAVGSGVYFYEISADQFRAGRRMILRR